MKSPSKCPTCNKVITTQQNNIWKPFCCERCKLIDLGAWIDGSNCIPGEEVNIEDIDMENLQTRH